MKKEQKPKLYSNKQKKTKKTPPIKVQLSKEDLVELLTVLKNFIVEEIFANFKIDVHHRMDCHNRRITFLERYTKTQEITGIAYCPHDDRLDCISYSRITGAFLSANYKCKRCGRENRKIWCFLTRKEKKALRNLGITIK